MLSRTENGSGPLWSPDGRSIGFFAEDKLKVLRLAEGSVRVVCDAPPGSGTSISSSVVLVAPGRSGGVTEVNVETGAFRDVTWPGRETGDVTHGHPMSLPDGRHFLCSEASGHLRRDARVARRSRFGLARARAVSGPVH